MASTTISFSSAGYNGLMDWLGKDKGTTTWAHPETTRAHVVSKHFTEFNSSYGSENVFSQSSSTVWHSKTDAADQGTTQELRFDFGDGQIVPTHFAMQGRSVNATDGPSAFTLLGSIDGGEWVTLLEASSATWTTSGWNDWAISDASGDGYRFFELIITGLSEAGNSYYSIGEIEFYGSYSDGNPTTVSQETYRPYVHAGYNGLLDFIGCSGRNIVNAYANPSPLDITLSSWPSHATYTPARATNESNGFLNLFTTNDSAGSYFRMDLGEGVAWVVNAFAFQVTDGANYPYNWKLQGSDNGTDWTDLYDNAAEPAGKATYDWIAVEFENTTPYRYYQWINTGLSSAGTNYYTAAYNVEFYGATEEASLPSGGGGGLVGRSVMLLGAG